MSTGRSVLAMAGGIALQALIATPVFADVTYSGGCVGAGGFFSGGSNCVMMKRRGPIGPAGIYQVKEPSGQDLEEALERDRKWLARCKPVIRQDSYGLGRYYYAASGCEFGKFDN